jgi:hypothetical protein
MPREKKSKVDEIETLRKILDNPWNSNNSKMLSSDDKNLDSVRKRLNYESVISSKKYFAAADKPSFSLEPTVTIHPRERTVLLPQPAAPLPEFEPVPSPAVVEQPIVPEEPLFVMEDLIEIEKVDAIYPEFVEVLPNEVSTTHEEIPRQPEETLSLKEPTGIDQNLPEWQPVDETQPNEPVVHHEEPAVQQEEQPTEEIPEFERLSTKMIPSETDEKLKAWEPEPESELKDAPPHEPPEFQPWEPQKQPQNLTRQQARAQKKLEKQKEKEAKREKKIEIKKLKMEVRQKEKEARQLFREQPKVELPVETPSIAPEPVPVIEQPTPVQIDLTAFKGIDSIDERTGELLYKNGYFSLENLREATIDELVQIKGIKRKLAKTIKKEIEEKTAKKPEEEFTPIKKRVSSKKPKKEPGDVTEWESFSVEDSDEGFSTTAAATHGKYTLYKRKIGKGKNKTTIHFFSKEKPAVGTPAKVPKGYQIAVNKKTKIPYLKKKK